MSILSKFTRHEGDPKVLSTGQRSQDASDGLARGLGWFSLGLGMLQIVAPQRITRAFGIPGSEHVVRAYGAREIASGMLTLSTEKKAGLASRVAGDGLDIATLVGLLAYGSPRRSTVKAALAMVVGIAVLDLVATKAVAASRARPKGNGRDYSDRSGFPGGVASARGIARSTSPDHKKGQAGFGVKGTQVAETTH
jgi:hypothetical protein